MFRRASGCLPGSGVPKQRKTKQQQTRRRDSESFIAYDFRDSFTGNVVLHSSHSIFSGHGTGGIHANRDYGRNRRTAPGILAVTFDDGKGGQALAVINPHNTGLPYTLSGDWNLVADVSNAGAAVLARESGTVTVDAISIRVYVNDTLAQ